jgi:hypothetical protein
MECVRFSAALDEALRVHGALGTGRNPERR